MSVRFGSNIKLGLTNTITPKSFPNLRVWMRSDDPEVVIGGGAITSIPNRGSIGGLIDNTTTFRPLDSTLNNRRSPLFDGDDDSLASDQATSDFTFMHDGTGVTVLGVVRRTSVSARHRLFGTARLGLTQTGLLFYADTDGSATFRIQNSSGTGVVNSTIADVAPVDTTIVLWARHKTGETPEWEWGHGEVIAASGSEAVTPDSGVPEIVLNVGRAVSETTEGHIPEIITYSDYLSDTDIQSLVTYLFNRWR